MEIQCVIAYGGEEGMSDPLKATAEEGQLSTECSEVRLFKLPEG